MTLIQWFPWLTQVVNSFKCTTWFHLYSIPRRQAQSVYDHGDEIYLHPTFHERLTLHGTGYVSNPQVLKSNMDGIK